MKHLFYPKKVSSSSIESRQHKILAVLKPPRSNHHAYYKTLAMLECPKLGQHACYETFAMLEHPRLNYRDCYKIQTILEHPISVVMPIMKSWLCLNAPFQADMLAIEILMGLEHPKMNYHAHKATILRLHLVHVQAILKGNIASNVDCQQC